MTSQERSGTKGPREGALSVFPSPAPRPSPHHCHVQHGRPEKVIAQIRTRWTDGGAHPCTSREKGNNVMNRHHRSNPATRTRGRQKRRILTGLLPRLTVTAASLAAAQAPAGAHATVHSHRYPCSLPQSSERTQSHPCEYGLSPLPRG